MTLRSNLMLAGATLATAFGGFAANATTLYAGGASLPAPYLRQAADCWGDKLDLAFRNVATTQTIADFNYKPGTTAELNCGVGPHPYQVTTGNAVSYISTGSGRGILGYFAHTPFFNGAGGDSWLGAAGSATPAPAQYATKVTFAASEAGLPQTDLTNGGDIDTYNGTSVDGSGNSVGRLVSQSGSTIRVASNTGAAPVGSGTGTNVLYPNPRVTYGRAIQIPLLIAVPAISFDPVYKRTADASGVITDTTFTNILSGKVKLSNTQLCNIFNGYDTNLGQDGLAATFGVKAGDTPASIPLQIVGRSDGSGTTSIFYRHLEAICDAYLGSNVNQYKVDANVTGANAGNAPTSLPVALRGATYKKTSVTVKANLVQPAVTGTETPGKFTLADGNDGVAEYLANVSKPANGTSVYQFRIGYVGNDFVLPYVLNNGQNNFGLISTLLVNKLGAFVAATPAGATKAFGSSSVPATLVLPPQTLSTGKYSVTAPGNRADPATNATNYTWVSAANIASPLADPAASGAYPLVGTTNALFYQCYANSAETGTIKAFLSWYYGNKIVTDASAGILAKNGLAPVTKPYQTAILETFVSNPTYADIDPSATTTPGKLNLDFGTKGVSTPQCDGVTTGA